LPFNAVLLILVLKNNKTAIEKGLTVEYAIDRKTAFGKGQTNSPEGL